MSEIENYSVGLRGVSKMDAAKLSGVKLNRFARILYSSTVGLIRNVNTLRNVRHFLAKHSLHAGTNMAEVLQLHGDPIKNRLSQI